MLCPPSGRHTSVALLALVALLLPVAAPRAADTAPSLALAAADAVRGDAGVLLRLDATFPRDDAVQLRFPLQLLVRALPEGQRFVRFDLMSGAVGDELAALSDGLDASNVWQLLDLQTPEPGARLVAMRPERLEVLLPPHFPSGAAEAQLFFIYEGAPIFSNPLVVDVPAQEFGR